MDLIEGGEFHTHAGPVDHADMLGREEGITVRSRRGGRYTVVRPTLAEVVLKMPRGAQVIYPKDLGPLLILADVFPGARILESGLGSGALSMTLLRAGAVITGYEIRADFMARARANVIGFLGPGILDRYQTEIRDVYEGIGTEGLDRVVLDLPEPWQVVPHAARALNMGGLFVAYLPTIGQVATLRAALDDGGFGMAETIEILQRSWHIDGQSVRPDHRMVAHTGFLTVARLLGSAVPVPSAHIDDPHDPGAEPGPDEAGADEAGPAPAEPEAPTDGL